VICRASIAELAWQFPVQIQGIGNWERTNGDSYEHGVDSYLFPTLYKLDCNLLVCPGVLAQLNKAVGSRVDILDLPVSRPLQPV